MDGSSPLKKEISKAFATEGTEATEVSGPRDKRQIRMSRKADLSFMYCRIFIRSLYISVLSVPSVAK
jgi:hypothetical protein